MFRKRDNDTSKPIAGEKGRWYSFEFRYRSEGEGKVSHSMAIADRSKDYIRTRLEAPGSTTAQPLGQNSSLGEITLVEDKEFLLFRDEDKVERQLASEAFKRRQAALAGGKGVEIAKTTQKKTASAAPSKRSSESSQRNQPQFCNCPDASHNLATKAPRASRGSGPRQARPRVPKSNISSNAEATSRAIPNTEKDLQPDENNPTVCTKCSGLKVTDSQRPAFLRKWYGENPQPRDEDTDDEEELPPPPAEQPKDPNVENPSEIEGADKAADEGESENTETPASVASGDEASQEEAHESAIVAEEATAAKEPEELIANPSNDAATHTPDNVAAIATGPAVSSAGDKGKASSEDVVAADTSNTLTEEAAEHAQAMQDEQPPLAGATPSRKRTSKPPADVRPAKQQRIDIDLTVEDPVTIKKEDCREESQSTEVLNTEDTEDREELQAQLLDIKIKREELQLRRREAEVERKLRELARKEKSKSSRPSTDLIKIED